MDKKEKKAYIKPETKVIRIRTERLLDGSNTGGYDPGTGGAGGGQEGDEPIKSRNEWGDSPESKGLW